MAEYRLRRASIADARLIAELHARAWRETYLGVMREEALASIDLDDWTRWLARIGSSEDAQAVFIACEGETLVGFARCARQSNPKLVPLGFEGEIASIYLLLRAQRRGLGRRLMQRLAAHLMSAGCASAAVWVLRDAPKARGFYEALGAEPVGVEGVWEIAGDVLPDIAYGWRDLRALSAGAGSVARSPIG
ncbi:GNAT family N-acetyltransferase [Methylocystis sp. SC2]|uniref:GNAT family N-acetyltransferase n=1 Tax=Methylocystis sp. (strain SC2) TaxID=187303 RepID=UPI00027AE7F6|nr:GNAT family N-acetyltransferase [Methylocystis sp. SC2]CCJ05525.1 GCN5-related N-acetyltransferase [Methylocystis sp. SC2]